MDYSVDFKTVQLIGALNRLVRDYNDYGICSLSETNSRPGHLPPFEGLVFDDAADRFDGRWHCCPLRANRVLEELGIEVEVAWSDDPMDEAPSHNPCIWFSSPDDMFTVHIDRDGWYV